jgi:hypothetical protein
MGEDRFFMGVIWASRPPHASHFGGRRAIRYITFAHEAHGRAPLRASVVSLLSLSRVLRTLVAYNMTTKNAYKIDIFSSYKRSGKACLAATLIRRINLFFFKIYIRKAVFI